jgi:hypothetical protein
MPGDLFELIQALYILSHNLLIRVNILTSTSSGLSSKKEKAMQV